MPFNQPFIRILKLFKSPTQLLKTRIPPTKRSSPSISTSLYRYSLLTCSSGKHSPLTSQTQSLFLSSRSKEEHFHHHHQQTTTLVTFHSLKHRTYYTHYDYHHNNKRLNLKDHQEFYPLSQIEPSILVMDLQVKDNELRDRAHKLCCEHLGGAWLKISPKEMSFTPITGGMSNLLYCCSLPDDIQLNNGEPAKALLRLYGEASRSCDMSLQVQIFELLSNRELGPKLYGNFEDGRLEEFLPAHSLTCDELMNHDVSSIIARKLAAVHSLEVPNMDKNTNWILERFNEWLDFIENNRKLPEYPDGFLRESTRKVAKTLLSIDFAKEIKFMKKVFEGTKSPIVFSHNDLHQGNILLTKPTKRRSQLDKRVILIDFEYCSYNYRGYDIANHFSEWCFEYDTPEYPHFALYMDRFPSSDIQREFIRNYLDQKKRLSSAEGSDASINNLATANRNSNILNNNNKCYRSGSLSPSGLKSAPTTTTTNGICSTSSKLSDNIGSFNNGHHYQRSAVNHHHPNGSTQTGNKALKLQATESDKEVEAILNEVVPFCMAANLVWTFWCIKSAYSSNIKFGYWEHAMTRWQIYSSLKQSYIIDRTTKRIRTPLKTTVANGHSVSSPSLTPTSTLSDISG